MKLETIIAERLKQIALFSDQPNRQGCEAMVEEFEQSWRALGRELLERQLQSQVEAVEQQHQGCRQRRCRSYQTPLGTIELKRRVYGSQTGWRCWADEELGLPGDGWFRSVKELASALGVSNEFANAKRLLERWSGVGVSEKTVANHVERYGVQLAHVEATEPVEAVCPVRSSVSAAVCSAPERPVLYIGADGIHTPLKHGATREAKVGVLFWQADHWKTSLTRRIVRQREYVATLASVESFRDHLNERYAQLVQTRPHQVVFLGDGAAWIWAMATLLFPDCIQILDFFHLSEYLWEVARAAFPTLESAQHDWVEAQQAWLKQSLSSQVVAAVGRLPPGSTQLQAAINSLLSYLHHNQTRIDYKRYLQLGLMIGSGVVESSNRRIVTQRLKQSGMFWSTQGAQSVMSLRACYLSNSNRWHDLWYQNASAA